MTEPNRPEQDGVSQNDVCVAGPEQSSDKVVETELRQDLILLLVPKQTFEQGLHSDQSPQDAIARNSRTTRNSVQYNVTHFMNYVHCWAQLMRRVRYSSY